MWAQDLMADDDILLAILALTSAVYIGVMWVNVVFNSRGDDIGSGVVKGARLVKADLLLLLYGNWLPYSSATKASALSSMPRANDAGRRGGSSSIIEGRTGKGERTTSATSSSAVGRTISTKLTSNTARCSWRPNARAERWHLADFDLVPGGDHRVGRGLFHRRP